MEGLADLTEKLRQLGEVAGVKVLRSAARKAMEPVLAEAKARAPYDANSGGPHLRDALAITVKKSGYVGGDVVATAGLKIKRLPSKARKFIKAMRARGHAMVHSDPRRYWHLVEFGTSHSAAKPFVRVAMAYQAEHVLAVLQVFLRKKVEAALRKQNPGSGA